MGETAKSKLFITPEMCETHFFKNGQYKSPILTIENDETGEFQKHHENVKNKIENLQFPEEWIIYDDWKDNPLYSTFYNDQCEGKRTRRKPVMGSQNLGTMFLILKSEYQPVEGFPQSKKRKTTVVPPISLGQVNFGHFSNDTHLESLSISWICTKKDLYSGAGKILMNKTKQLAQINGYKGIELYSMEEPVEFYKKMGFVHMYENPAYENTRKRKRNNSAERNFMEFIIDEKTTNLGGGGGKSRKRQKLIGRQKTRKTHKKLT